MAARGEMANPTLHRNMEAMNLYGSIAHANIDTPGCIGVRNQDGNAIQLCLASLCRYWGQKEKIEVEPVLSKPGLQFSSGF